MKQLVFTLALSVLACAPALAEDNHSGFGDSFAQIGHAGFEDPQDVVATSDDLAKELAGIEPAAGEDIDAPDNKTVKTEATEEITDMPEAE